VLGNQVKRNYLKVPVVINSALEIAAVGLSEEQADAAGFAPEVARASLGGCVRGRAPIMTMKVSSRWYTIPRPASFSAAASSDGGGRADPPARRRLPVARGLWLLKDMSYSHPSWCEELETAIDPYTAALSRSGKELFTPGILAML